MYMMYLYTYTYSTKSIIEYLTHIHILKNHNISENTIRLLSLYRQFLPHTGFIDLIKMHDYAICS